MELQLLGACRGGTTYDPLFMGMRKVVEDCNAGLREFVLKLRRLSDKDYERIRLAGKLLIDDKPVKNLTKNQLIARVEREAASKVVVQTTGRFAAAKTELASLAGCFQDSYTYDALGIMVHGNSAIMTQVNGKISLVFYPGGIMDFNGENVRANVAKPVFLEIGSHCPAHLVIASCYANAAGKVEVGGIAPAYGYITTELNKVGDKPTLNESGSYWNPCTIVFHTYRFQLKYEGDANWFDWDKTYEQTYVVPGNGPAGVVPDKPAGVVPDNGPANPVVPDNGPARAVQGHSGVE